MSVKIRDKLFQRQRAMWNSEAARPIQPAMTEAVQSNDIRPSRRPRRLDRLDVISLAWFGLFAVVTAALALALQ